jgi:hypothetical protein
MAGFIINVESNNKWWYLLGALLFLGIGVATAIAGFASPAVGAAWGITGIVVAVVSAIFVIDALLNL